MTNDTLESAIVGRISSFNWKNFEKNNEITLNKKKNYKTQKCTPTLREVKMIMFW